MAFPKQLPQYGHRLLSLFLCSLSFSPLHKSPPPPDSFLGLNALLTPPAWLPALSSTLALGNKWLYKVPFDCFIPFPVFALELEATRGQYNSAVAFVCLGSGAGL